LPDSLNRSIVICEIREIRGLNFSAEEASCQGDVESLNRCTDRANSITSAQNADSFIFGGGIPEHRVLAADRLALSTSAPHTPVALVSSADTARSPNLSLPAHSGFYARPVPLKLILSLERGES
jgi:hypothetical protein